MLPAAREELPKAVALPAGPAGVPPWQQIEHRVQPSSRCRYMQLSGPEPPDDLQHENNISVCSWSVQVALQRMNVLPQ